MVHWSPDLRGWWPAIVLVGIENKPETFFMGNYLWRVEVRQPALHRTGAGRITFIAGYPMWCGARSIRNLFF
jgi:hypothetical protein